MPRSTALVHVPRSPPLARQPRQPPVITLVPNGYQEVPRAAPGLQGALPALGAAMGAHPAGLALGLASEASGRAAAVIRDALQARQFRLRIERVQVGTRRQRGRYRPIFALRPTELELTPTAGGILGAGLILVAFGGLKGLAGFISGVTGAAAGAADAAGGTPDWWKAWRDATSWLPLGGAVPR